MRLAYAQRATFVLGILSRAPSSSSPWEVPQVDRTRPQTFPARHIASRNMRIQQHKMSLLPLPTTTLAIVINWVQRMGQILRHGEKYSNLFGEVGAKTGMGGEWSKKDAWSAPGTLILPHTPCVCIIGPNISRVVCAAVPCCVLYCVPWYAFASCCLLRHRCCCLCVSPHS